ncbi:MAG: crossover junction endodeoxyribonuclease RuvC [Bacteroidota bacterium]
MNSTLKSYRLIGIDPGTNNLGYAILEVRGKKLLVGDLGTVSFKKHLSHQQKLKLIFERIQTIIDLYNPIEMAIEAPFYGKNVQSMLKLGRAQGVAIVAAMTKGLEIVEYSPKKIKQVVTGNGNAAKEQVAAMLEHQLKIKLADYSLDATDALGAAFCHYHQAKGAIGKGKKYNNWQSFIEDNPNRLG